MPASTRATLDPDPATTDAICSSRGAGVLSNVSARFSAWYAREAASPGYDAVLRIPALAYFALLIGSQINGLADLLATVPERASTGFAMTVSARLAFIAFLAFQCGLTLFRTRVRGRAAGLRPRAAAILGSVFTFALVLLPRAAPSLAWDATSVGLILVGDLLAAGVLLWLGRSFSTMPEARRLVVKGPYHFIRHPLYAAEEIAIIGVYVQFRSLPALVLLAIHFALQVERMRQEERVLSRQFPEYAGYMQRTARIVPGIF
ncbi:MAG TPA: isoprenylcysteine carboxylmethyltransferase family protein [Candidatus Cybelea sp.]|nr:isoprenylcysteine carboxylmethyltransferase family protein [Candidatus Cybelea sp.]